MPKRIKRIVADQSPVNENTPLHDDSWLLNRMLQQRDCKHPKSHNDGGVEYCNECGASLRINTYRD